MDASHLLGNAAFGASLLSCWLYGESKWSGPVCGLVCASLFITYGVVSDVPAAILSNLFFIFIHIRNLRRFMHEQRADTVSNSDRH